MIDTGESRRKRMTRTSEEKQTLSIVKMETVEMEDYGHNSGNILDNFIQEHDYDDFPQHVPVVPSSDQGEVDVDWLSTFFDEPSHSNMTGLNPALCDVTFSSNYPSHRITSINCDDDHIMLDSMTSYSDEFSQGSDGYKSPTSLRSPDSPSSPGLRNSNPLLCQTDVHRPARVSAMSPKDSLLVTSKQDVKLEVDVSRECQEKLVNSPLEIEVEKQRQIGEKPCQQKLLLFMNTPENRAKLVGANYNIINANLLTKLSGQSFQKCDSTGTVISLKNCLKLNNVVKQDSPLALKSGLSNGCENVVFSTDKSCGKILLRRDRLNTISNNLQNNLNQALLPRDKDMQSIDSGYESPDHSSNSSPGSPQIDVEGNDGTSYLETIHHVDIPPHERQPFFLSPEERRTLVAEGLPIPQGLPLSKVEERALKKVRRKIKNKISAQESRRKKKEYMEALEKKVDNFSAENGLLKKKVTTLEVANRSLVIQVQKLQALVTEKYSAKPAASQAMQTEGAASDS